MILDRSTQQLVVSSNGFLVLEDDTTQILMSKPNIVSVTYNNDTESVTISQIGDAEHTHTIHRTDKYGNIIEADSTARDLALRIVTLIENS